MRPKLNMRVRPRRLYRVIFKPQSKGIGKRMIIKSMRRLRLVEESSSPESSRHHPPGTGFQEFETGRQCDRKTPKKLMPYATVNPMTTNEAMRNEREVKMRL